MPLSQDRLRIVHFVNDGDVLTLCAAALSGRATAPFGIDGLGAHTAVDASPLLPLSRQGADATFQKFDIALAYNQTLIGHLAVSFTVRAQTSFNRPLLRSEQIGNPTRFELLTPISFSILKNCEACLEKILLPPSRASLARRHAPASAQNSARDL